ncbi:HET-domain-containing protein [Acephala macrosclerotiorum]|nr:HET-domain-containing protein [Acephala macrosclerotiorum]
MGIIHSSKDFQSGELTRIWQSRLTVKYVSGSEILLCMHLRDDSHTPDSVSKTYPFNVPLKHVMWSSGMKYDTEIERSTASESTFTFAKEWLETCQNTHPRCPLTMAFTPPTRLIEITDNGLRLCNTKETRINPPYTTLSHCWGKAAFFTLTRSNMASLRQSIRSEDLCKTFQDAISVTKRLGFYYLWIDSLCIVQDDEEDWRLESALMSQVYGNAAVNIAATKAKNGTFGLFTERDVFKVLRPIITLHPPRQFNPVESPERPYAYEVVDNDSYCRCVGSSPLSNRGWAFQERFLSPRTLHFTSERLFCECYCGIVCETFPNGIPRERRVQSTFPSDRNVLRSWFQAVALYSDAKLTYADDKLIAISGIARHFHNISKDQYIAGLWRQNIQRQLCWRVDVDRGWAEEPQNTRYQAPTFSWAHINQRITWKLQSHVEIVTDLNVKPIVSVVGVDVKPVGSDPLGQLEDARLRLLCGPLIKSSVVFGPTRLDQTLWIHVHETHLTNGKVQVFSSSSRIYCDSRDDDERYMKKEGYAPVTRENEFFLPILEAPRYGSWLSVCGLMIATIPSRGKGYFKRIGVCAIHLNTQIATTTFSDLTKFLLKDRTSLMDESLYEEIFLPNDESIPQYTITLV